MKTLKTIALPAALLAACAAAAAQPSPDAPSPWWVHAGPVHIQFHTDSVVSAGGSELPGAGIKASSNTTLGFEFGYDLTPNIAARLTVGIPPTTRLTGSGALAGAGEVGRITYGPAVLSVTWAFDGTGAFRPYVGAGANYTLVLASKDAAITSLNAKNAFGSVLQSGFDVALDRHWGLFVDAKKIFLRAKATGFVGPAPASASVRLDPLLIQAGVGYRF